VNEAMENALRKDLFMIVLLWDDLLDLPRILAGHHGTRNEAPLPIPVDVLSLRREAGEQLASWAHLVYDERGLHTRLDLMNIIGVCRFLTTHAQFLTGHVAAHDACDEIGAIATKVEEFVRQTRPRRFVVGMCPDCEGALVVILRNSDALLPSEVRCSLNSAHAYTPWEWTRLGERLRQWDEDATRRLAAAIRMP